MTTSALHRDTDLILSVEDVNKTFDGFKAISDLNFYLAEGELRTIIGPNGAGKSTFMDMITGRTRPDTGKLTIIRGLIDLIFEEPDGWVIVDYKTDDLASSDTPSAIHYYQPQLQSGY